MIDHNRIAASATTAGPADAVGELGVGVGEEQLQMSESEVIRFCAIAK
jgi:hypothetical protein